MDVLSITAAAGMKARLEALDFTANNLANQSTPGYKAEREQFSLYWSEAAGAAQDNEQGVVQALLPTTSRRYTDLTQGELKRTENETDLALANRGFFTVLGANGPLYTRNGHFEVATDGRLVTKEGYGLAGTDGKPITVTPGTTINVNPDGTVMQGTEVRGKLGIVDWPTGTDTLRQEGGYFSLDSASSLLAQPITGQIKQGYLEHTNSSATDSAIRLVDISRQFEALQKASQMASDMNRKACEDIGRIV